MPLLQSECEAFGHRFSRRLPRWMTSQVEAGHKSSLMGRARHEIESVLFSRLSKLGHRLLPRENQRAREPTSILLSKLREAKLITIRATKQSPSHTWWHKWILNLSTSARNFPSRARLKSRLPLLCSIPTRRTRRRLTTSVVTCLLSNVPQAANPTSWHRRTHC